LAQRNELPRYFETHFIKPYRIQAEVPTRTVMAISISKLWIPFLSHFIMRNVVSSNMYPCRTSTDTASATNRTKCFIKTTYTSKRVLKANIIKSVSNFIRISLNTLSLSLSLYCVLNPRYVSGVKLPEDGRLMPETCRGFKTQ
jgi:hypothetical protein